jgi:hypothetical protein
VLAGLRPCVQFVYHFFLTLLQSYLCEWQLQWENKWKSNSTHQRHGKISWSNSQWWKKSGLKINDEKTEYCLFFKHNTAAISIQLGDVKIKSKIKINALGILLNSKLKLSCHVPTVITKANKALNVITIIRKFFISKELIILLRSNYYSVLYYNSEVWHLRSLKCNISANTLRVTLHYPDPSIIFIDLHRQVKRVHGQWSVNSDCPYCCIELLTLPYQNLSGLD